MKVTQGTHNALTQGTQGTDQGSFRTVARAKTRLELLIETVCCEMIVELCRDYPFQHLRQEREVGDGAVVGWYFRVKAGLFEDWLYDRSFQRHRDMA